RPRLRHEAGRGRRVRHAYPALVRRRRGGTRRAAGPVRAAGRAHARPGPAAGTSIGETMKYMMMFWVDEAAEATPDEDAAMMIAVKAWVDQMTESGVMVHGGALRSA